MQPPIFSCFHQVYTLPINNDYTTTKTEDGQTQISGLCRTCQYSHCEAKHQMLKEYWLGRIHEQKRAVMNARDRLWFHQDEQLASLTADAERLLEAWARQMERELEAVWQDFEERWGQ